MGSLSSLLTKKQDKNMNEDIENQEDIEKYIMDKLPIGAVIGSACSRHKPKQLGYLQWYYWAEQKIKRGAKQKQCPKCGRWYFREEF